MKREWEMLQLITMKRIILGFQKMIRVFMFALFFFWKATNIVYFINHRNSSTRGTAGDLYISARHLITSTSIIKNQAMTPPHI